MTWIQRIFGKNVPAAVTAPPPSLGGAAQRLVAPSYPPPNPGIPAAPVDAILKSQAELAFNFRLALGMEPEEFEAMMQPTIRNFCAMVHLLPASETHHHSAPGGLFHHSLEAGFRAARLTESVIFSDGTPRHRRRMEVRWRVATGLAGLLHDLGKAWADMEVTNEDGSQTWQPPEEPLEGWLLRTKTQQYYVRWKEGREKQHHEQMAWALLHHVLPPKFSCWLAKYGNEPYVALMSALAGIDNGNLVARMARRADRTSVELDAKARRGSPGQIGIPVHGYILDAMRQLVGDKEWAINQPGGIVWVLRNGVFLHWEVAARTIVKVLKANGVPGIPRSADTLADILLERDLAVPRYVGEATMYRYWPVSPDAETTPDGARTRHLMLQLKALTCCLAQQCQPPSWHWSVMRRTPLCQSGLATARMRLKNRALCRS